MRVDGQMRLAYVVKRFPRYSETFIVNEILAHEAAGCSVEVFSLRPPIDTHFQDVLARVRAPVRYVPSEGIRSPEFWQACREAAASGASLDELASAAIDEEGRDVFQALVLCRWLRDGGFDHVHAHFASLPATVTRLAARLARCGWTFTAHAKDVFHESVREDDLERKCREAAAVVTVSRFNVAHLAQRFPAAVHRIVHVPNGLDLSRIPMGDHAARTIDVLAVGRIVEKKGFDVLIEAIARLWARGRSIRCEIIGDGEQAPALRALSQRLGVERVVSCTGPRPQAEVLAAMRSARVFAAPCIVAADGNRDGLPTVILEAMASGAACVATPVTGIPEIVRHGETGLLVPQGDPARLADAIGTLLDTPGLRRSCADNARRLIEAEFDARQTAAALRGVFLSVREPRHMETVA